MTPPFFTNNLLRTCQRVVNLYIPAAKNHQYMQQQTIDTSSPHTTRLWRICRGGTYQTVNRFIFFSWSEVKKNVIYTLELFWWRFEKWINVLRILHNYTSLVYERKAGVDSEKPMNQNTNDQTLHFDFWQMLLFVYNSMWRHLSSIRINCVYRDNSIMLQ